MTNQYLNNKELYIEIIVSKAQGRLTRNAERLARYMSDMLVKEGKFEKIEHNKYKAKV